MVHALCFTSKKVQSHENVFFVFFKKTNFTILPFIFKLISILGWFLLCIIWGNGQKIFFCVEYSYPVVLSQFFFKIMLY